MSVVDYPFELPPLPWKKSELAPFLSERAITLHYDHQHKAYVDKINKLANEFPELQSLNLYQIVDRYTGTIHQNAAQALNHDFFWKCLGPNKTLPSGSLYAFIQQQFSSYDNFIREFSQKAQNHFGSGWIWLAYNPSDETLLIIDGSDDYIPTIDGYVPLLCLDMWEHSYYPDYQYRRNNYINLFWDKVNWRFVERTANQNIFKVRNFVSETS